MISTLIALPYEIARRPLAVVDDKLSERLPETSRPRLVLDRTLGSADKLAGTLLRNGGIAKRGSDRIERFEKLSTAARLEQKADAKREQGSQTVAAGREEAAEKRKAAQDRAASSLQEAQQAEVRGKQEATAKARKNAAAKKSAADKQTQSRVNAAEQRKQRAAKAAETKKQAEQRQAKAELDEARETKKSAAASRADADRLDDLAEVKKQERKSDS